MAARIHVIEPTLVDEAGHCHSFLGAVCGAGPGEQFEIYAGRHAARGLLNEFPNVKVRPHFRRLPRRFQAWWLYSRLIRRPDRIFVPTAGANDLSLLDLAAFGRPVRRARVAMFFHWIRPTWFKRLRMGLVARHQPEMLVLGPTAEIVELLDGMGFRRTRQVPYPVTTRARPPEGPPRFRYALFAGAARLDKGFDKVVDLVQRLHDTSRDVPVAVQTSSKHYGKRDGTIGAEIERLEAIRYGALQTYPSTASASAYLERFHGAVCLQPYDPREFAGRVSAVTIDALASGAPIVTTAGTWIGRTVEQHDAGVVVSDPSASNLDEALRQVIDAYDRYSANAREAARRIQQDNSGAHLVRAVLDA